MNALLVATVAVLGWLVRPVRRVRRRAPGRPLGTPAALAPLARRLQGVVPTAPPPDPTPLLRFRSAIGRGASVVQAFEAVAVGHGPWADGARRLVRQVGAGAGVQAAVDGWAAEERDPALHLLADALAISGATGGSHVRAVDAVIDAVRDRASLHREVRALASQAQTSAIVLVLLPLAFAVGIAVVDARVRAFFLHAPLGAVLVVAGLALDAIGAWLMLRLVRGVA